MSEYFRGRKTIDITAGSSSTPVRCAARVAIRAVPVSGGTVTVSTSFADDGSISGAYVDWDEGAVSTATDKILDVGNVWIKATAATQDATVYLIEAD